MHKDEGYAAQATDGGAAGYVLKDFGADELALAVRFAAAAGKSYVSPAISEQAIQNYRQQVVLHGDVLATLTEREGQILQPDGGGAYQLTPLPRVCT